MPNTKIIRRIGKIHADCFSKKSANDAANTTKSTIDTANYFVIETKKGLFEFLDSEVIMAPIEELQTERGAYQEINSACIIADELSNMFDEINDYQKVRSDRFVEKVAGNVKDHTNIFCQELKVRLKAISSIKDTKVIENEINLLLEYIDNIIINEKELFPSGSAHSDEKHMNVVLCELKDLLKIAKEHIAFIQKTDPLPVLLGRMRQNTQSAIEATVKYLLIALRNTHKKDFNSLGYVRALREKFAQNNRAILETDAGRLLMALANSPIFMLVYPNSSVNGYRGVDAERNNETLEAHKNAIASANPCLSFKGKDKLADTRYNRVEHDCTINGTVNAFRVTTEKKPLDLTSSHSGIELLFRSDPELLKQFIELHGLLYELGRNLLVNTSGETLSKEIGDIGFRVKLCKEAFVMAKLQALVSKKALTILKTLIAKTDEAYSKSRTGKLYKPETKELAERAIKMGEINDDWRQNHNDTKQYAGLMSTYENILADATDIMKIAEKGLTEEAIERLQRETAHMVMTTELLSNMFNIQVPTEISEREVNGPRELKAVEIAELKFMARATHLKVLFDLYPKHLLKGLFTACKLDHQEEAGNTSLVAAFVKDDFWSNTGCRLFNAIKVDLSQPLQKDNCLNWVLKLFLLKDQQTANFKQGVRPEHSSQDTDKFKRLLIQGVSKDLLKSLNKHEVFLLGYALTTIGKNVEDKLDLVYQQLKTILANENKLLLEAAQVDKPGFKNDINTTHLLLILLDLGRNDVKFHEAYLSYQHHDIAGALNLINSRDANAQLGNRFISLIQTRLEGTKVQDLVSMYLDHPVTKPASLLPAEGEAASREENVPAASSTTDVASLPPPTLLESPASQLYRSGATFRDNRAAPSLPSCIKSLHPGSNIYMFNQQRTSTPAVASEQTVASPTSGQQTPTQSFRNKINHH